MAVLHCVRITGSHTYDKIYEKFVECLATHNIEAKLFKMISDSGANVKKAFKDFSEFNIEVEEDEDDTETNQSQPSDDEPEIIAIHGDEIEGDNVDNKDEFDPDEVFDISELQEKFSRVAIVERYRCGAHNLHLAIQDSFEVDSTFERTMRKVKKLVSMAKKSTLFSDELRAKKIFLKKNMAVRWNSTYMMLDSCLKLSQSVQMFQNPSNSQSTNQKKKL